MCIRDSYNTILIHKTCLQLDLELKYPGTKNLIKDCEIGELLLYINGYFRFECLIKVNQMIQIYYDIKISEEGVMPLPPAAETAKRAAEAAGEREVVNPLLTPYQAHKQYKKSGKGVMPLPTNNPSPGSPSSVGNLGSPN